jgi:hypothetical protein
MKIHYISKDRNLITKLYKFYRNRKNASYSSRGLFFLSRAEISAKFLSMVLEKDEEDPLDRSCEERSITQSQGGNEYNLKRRRVNWIGHILRGKCLSKHIVQGKMERKVKYGKTMKKM